MKRDPEAAFAPDRSFLPLPLAGKGAVRLGDALLPPMPPTRSPRPALPVLLAVALLHLAMAATFQAAVRPAHALAMPMDPRDPVVFLMSPADIAQAVADDRPAHFAQVRTLPPLAQLSRSADLAHVEIGTGTPDARYQPATALDIGPVPAGAPDLAAATRHVLPMGSVLLRVYVSTFGYPDRVQILGVPLDGDFARALRQALEQTTFQPGRHGGHDVAAYVDYEFQPNLLVLPAPAFGRAS